MAENMESLAPGSELLLRLCCDPDGGHADLAARLDDAEWRSFTAMAIEQRAGPLALRALRRSGASERMPSDARVGLEADNRRHGLNGLRQAVAIAKLAKCLASAGFQPIFLKGAGLAFGCYPQPALRPLRDVDLLFPRAEMASAHAFLLGTGKYHVHPAVEHHSAHADQHLHPLMDTESGLVVEAHGGLGSHAPWPGEHMLTARLAAEAVPLAIGGMDVLVPSGEANALHIVQHAALSHLFDNGPLALADLHYLARSGTINQERLIADADAMGLGNALSLVAGIAARFGARWVAPALARRARSADPFISVSCRALLQGRGDAELNKLLRRLEADSGGTRRWRDAMAKALRPDPRQIALFAGEGSRAAGYVRWAADRARRYIRATGPRERRDMAGRVAEMARWLARP